MRIRFATLFLLLKSFAAFATAQYPDKLLYNGNEYAMHSNPLESFFEQHPDRRPKSGVVSTALWRGYVATFEIRDSLLYLKNIEIKVSDSVQANVYHTKWKSVLSEVFPEQPSVKVTWLTGLLVLPYDKLKKYVHMGYGSTYQNYLLLEIQEGKLKQAKHLSENEYEGFKNRQFEVFRQTEQYKQLKTDLLKQGSTEVFIDSFLKNYVTQYTSRILVD